MGDNWDDESSPYSSLFDTVFVTSQERHSVIWPISLIREWASSYKNYFFFFFFALINFQ